MEAILKRDRLIVIAALTGISGLAWGYLVHEAHAMSLTGICCCAGLKMSGPDTAAWSPATLFPLFLMWVEMMVAMMVPSAAPMILTFALVQRKRRQQERPFVSAGVFLLGYVVVWTAFSGLAAVAQWILHANALLSPMMVGTSPVLGGGLLLAAGLFQWSPWKNTCLRHCGSPWSFLLTDWREGRVGALVMGFKHGAYCTGCCWFLMMLLFVAGVMNLWWLALISVLVLLEKVAPRTWQPGKIAGALFAAWGLWLLIGTHG
jgi:predicted metal-binding membrane protein